MTAPAPAWRRPSTSGGNAPDWPSDNVLVLRSRPVRLGTPAEHMSRHGDPLWRISPAHRDAHIGVASIVWSAFPSGLRRHFKAFFQAALDYPVPVEPSGRQSPGEQASVSSIAFWAVDMRVFAHWLDLNGFQDLSAVRQSDLDTYLDHVRALRRSAARKADLIATLRTLWLFRDHLPSSCRLDCDYPWPGRTANQLVGNTEVRRRERENRTPRIADATMEALLAWCLLMTEEIGPDIRDAWQEYQQLDACTHPCQVHYSGTLRHRLPVYLDHCRNHGIALPGRPGPAGLEVNTRHIQRLVGVPAAQRSGFKAGHKRLLAASGLPVGPVTPVGMITGRVYGLPWRNGPIDVNELPTLVRLLSAAMFAVVSYLSGMRPGEVLNLRRGCRGKDDETGELLVYGHRGKGFDRRPDSPDTTEPLRPWVVVNVVHEAIALLEDLHDFPLLFPSSLVSAHAGRQASIHARASGAMNDDIQDLISWINSTYPCPDGTPAIPPDPHGHIYASRFRRTLARFIVRRPRGLIAAAIQYGHVDTKVTLSYAGHEDPSWLTDIAVERLEKVLEQIDEDAQRLGDGEHISGPSAADYRARIGRAATFTGRVVTAGRNVERLLQQVDPSVHHGEGMTCVWRADTAACRTAKLSIGLPANEAPDDSDCRSTCTNLAYTDRDITQLTERLTGLHADADDPLAPKPRRDRAAAQAARLAEVIDRHHNSRPIEENAR